MVQESAFRPHFPHGSLNPLRQTPNHLKRDAYNPRSQPNAGVVAATMLYYNNDLANIPTFNMMKTKKQKQKTKGRIPRGEAEKRLSSYTDIDDGTFLVRGSTRGDGGFVLSIW